MGEMVAEGLATVELNANYLRSSSIEFVGESSLTSLSDSSNDTSYRLGDDTVGSSGPLTPSSDSSIDPTYRADPDIEDVGAYFYYEI